MCKLIIAGHGSYGTSIRRSLHMIFGETEGIFFIDFTEEDSADTLRQKLEEAVSQCGSDSILFLSLIHIWHCIPALFPDGAGRSGRCRAQRCLPGIRIPGILPVHFS